MAMVARTCVACLLFWICGCNPPAEKPSKKPSPEPRSPQAVISKKIESGPKEKVSYPFDKATASIHGRVSFKGAPPERKEIDVSGDKAVAAYYRDRNEVLRSEAIVVSETGGLANVIVWVEMDSKRYEFPLVKEPFLLKIIGAHYVPHVFCVRTEQTIVTESDDPATHNNYWITKYPAGSLAFMYRKGPQIDRKVFRDAEIVPLRCDVHSWMNALCGVFDHPFFAVTRAEGTFEIPNLLPGSYKIKALHEQLGEKDFQLTVKDGQKAELNFEYDKNDK